MARILLDLTPLVTTANRRGIGRYVRGIVQGLDELGPECWHGLEILGLAANDDVDELLPPVRQLNSYVGREVQPPVKYCDIKRSSLVTLGFVRAARAADASLLHLTEPRGITMGRKPIVTVTSHDLIALAQPQLYLPRIPGWPLLYRGLEQLHYWSSQRILAISQATKRDLVEWLGFDERRIEVVHHGVDHQRFHPVAAPGEADSIHELLGSPAPYIVYVGAGDPRKDLDTLVVAHAKIASSGLHLVLAGHLEPRRRQSLRRLSERLGTSESVHLAGFVREALVAPLYRQAALHVFPSRYEGFGLPILEALASGTPTITSPGSSLEEVAGGAALLVPCGEPDALAAAMERLLSDANLCRAMRERGLLRAQEFTWKRCAQQTIEFWRHALD